MVIPLTRRGKAEWPSGWVEIDRAGLLLPAYEEIRLECHAEVGAPPVPAPITAAEAQQLYRWDLATRTCLVAHGFTVATPSLDSVYVAKYLAGQPPWNVYEGIVDVPRAQQWCPQRGLGES